MVLTDSRTCFVPTILDLQSPGGQPKGTMVDHDAGLGIEHGKNFWLFDLLLCTFLSASQRIFVYHLQYSQPWQLSVV